jgi:hypothetical protein
VKLAKFKHEVRATFPPGSHIYRMFPRGISWSAGGKVDIETVRGMLRLALTINGKPGPGWCAQ